MSADRSPKRVPSLAQPRTRHATLSFTGYRLNPTFKTITLRPVPFTRTGLTWSATDGDNREPGTIHHIVMAVTNVGCGLDNKLYW